MSEVTTPMYGMGNDEVKQATYRFGGNFGTCRLTKFEYINNAGKDGTEGEAIDVVFNIGGSEKNYRIFPVSKVFKDGKELTDPKSQDYQIAFKDAIDQLNAITTHILGCFRTKDEITTAFTKAGQIKSFKDFAQVLMGGLPKDYDEKPLDIFLQYQWTLKDTQKQTYLEIPRSMKYGKWLCAAMEGNWTEHKMENPSDSDTSALYYTKMQQLLLMQVTK
jgi:hypothetical protein